MRAPKAHNVLFSPALSGGDVEERSNETEGAQSPFRETAEERSEFRLDSPRGRDAERSDAERAAPPETSVAISSPLCPPGISPKGEKKHG
jgi:hypothetical protein